MSHTICLFTLQRFPQSHKKITIPLIYSATWLIAKFKCDFFALFLSSGSSFKSKKRAKMPLNQRHRKQEAQTVRKEISPKKDLCVQLAANDAIFPSAQHCELKYG